MVVKVRRWAGRDLATALAPVSPACRLIETLWDLDHLRERERERERRDADAVMDRLKNKSMVSVVLWHYFMRVDLTV